MQICQGTSNNTSTRTCWVEIQSPIQRYLHSLEWNWCFCSRASRHWCILIWQSDQIFRRLDRAWTCNDIRKSWEVSLGLALQGSNVCVRGHPQWVTTEKWQQLWKLFVQLVLNLHLFLECPRLHWMMTYYKCDQRESLIMGSHRSTILAKDLESFIMLQSVLLLDCILVGMSQRGVSQHLTVWRYFREVWPVFLPNLRSS